MKLPNIAIDGPAASGKTVVARLLAGQLGLVFLDTGAMYRTVAWIALEKHLDCHCAEEITALAEACSMDIKAADNAVGYKIVVEGRDITELLHEPRIDEAVPVVAAISGVRREMVRRQQAMAAHGGVIMVGRDITTVVMPQAECKYFLDAAVEERAHRRYLELSGNGVDISEEEVLGQMRERDYQDTNRSDSPLRLVSGVTRFDTTGLSISEVVEHLAAECRRYME